MKSRDEPGLPLRPAKKATNLIGDGISCQGEFNSDKNLYIRRRI